MKDEDFVKRFFESRAPHEEHLDSIEHYGIKGMRWGVRKDRRTGNRVGTPAAGTARAKRGAPSVSPNSKKKKSKPPKVNPSKLSTSDLQDRIARMKLEQEFKRLTSSSPSMKRKARKAVTDILVRTGTRQAEHLLNSVVKSTLDKWLISRGLIPASSDKKK